MKNLIKTVLANVNTLARTTTARVYEAVAPTEASIVEYRNDPSAYKQKRLESFLEVHSTFGKCSFIGYALTGRNRKVGQVIALTGMAVSLTHIYDIAAVSYHAKKAS